MFLLTIALARGLQMDNPATRRSDIGPKPRYYTVDQDHFDGSNKNVWSQAYYVNDTFWVPGSDAPVFLCVGGEGPPLDGSVVVASPHCNDAVEFLPETKGLMFALEHRYYGCHNLSACPVTSFTPADALRFLSSRQALQDAVAFRAFAIQAYGLTEKNKWVTFGGSYPGMLAGWLRLQYPHLFFASVSSSAPILAQLNMRGYYDTVANAYSVSNNNVGGSEECRAAIAGGHALIGTLFGSDTGRKRLASLFRLPSGDWLLDPKNQRNFAGEGVADFPAQSNDPVCTRAACNIKLICAIMRNTSIGDTVDRLAGVASAQRRWMGEYKWERLSKEKEEKRDGVLPDFWDYQTCTEFAFYQTCEVGSKCFFTQGLLLLDEYVKTCSQRFNIPPEKIEANVDFTNQIYGALKPSGSRVLSVNGEVDPWSSLALLKSPDPVALPTLWVEGASHHAWTHPTLPTDQDSVQNARQKIWAQLRTWLA